MDDVATSEISPTVVATKTTNNTGNRTPEISVIVPIYNVEKYLRGCVDSILAQTFKDFELFLIDDGSPDKCGELCDEYAKKDSRIRVFHKANGGVSSARNLGLKEAKGQWISFVDADDSVDEKFLEILHQSAVQANVDLVFCTFKTISEKSTPYHPNQQQSARQTVETTLQEMIAGYGCRGAPWNKLYRTDIIRKYNLKFDENISALEDFLFVTRFLKKSSAVFCVQHDLYNYLVHSESVTRSLSPKHYRDMINSINLVEAEVKNQPWSRVPLDKRKSETKFAILRRFYFPRKELLSLWKDASAAELTFFKRILLKAFYLPFPLWLLFCALPIKIFNKLERRPTPKS